MLLPRLLIYDDECQVLLVWALQSGADELSYFTETLERLVTARGQSRSAKSVEVFGWLILLEGSLVVLFPHFVAQILNLPPLVEQAANYFRLVGLLVSGLGMIYIASGRLNAAGFVFASLLDRPLVPFAMLIYCGILKLSPHP